MVRRLYMFLLMQRLIFKPSLEVEVPWNIGRNFICLIFFNSTSGIRVIKQISGKHHYYELTAFVGNFIQLW